jgi:hypothetical protein
MSEQAEGVLQDLLAAAVAEENFNDAASHSLRLALDTLAHVRMTTSLLSILFCSIRRTSVMK